MANLTSITLELTDAEVYALSTALADSRDLVSHRLAFREENPSRNPQHDRDAETLDLLRSVTLATLNRKVTAAVLTGTDVR